MEKRYRALRIISMLYKIAGAIVLVFAILSAVGVCLALVLGGAALQEFGRDFNNIRGMGLMSSLLGGILAGLAMLIGGGLWGLLLFAIGEGVEIIIAVEENTRTTAMYLAAQSRSAGPVSLPAPVSTPPAEV
jgi:hypothetical protein